MPGNLDSARFFEIAGKVEAALEFLSQVRTNGESLKLSSGTWQHEGIWTPGLLDIIVGAQGALVGLLSQAADLREDAVGNVLMVDEQEEELGRLCIRFSDYPDHIMDEVRVKRLGDEPFEAGVGCSIDSGSPEIVYSGWKDLPLPSGTARVSRTETPGRCLRRLPLMGYPAIRSEGVMILTLPEKMGVASGYDLTEYQRAPLHIARRKLEVPDLLGRFFVGSETDPLRVVILGNPDTYRLFPWLAQNHNPTQQKAAKLLDPSLWREKMREEFAGFERILRAHGIVVLYPDPTNNPYVQGQQTVRDVGGVIGDQYIEGRLLRPRRRGEHAFVEPLLHSLGLSSWRKPPPGAILEFGDVTFHNGKVLVGVGGQRTNWKGVAFLKEVLGPDIPVVPVPLQSWVLHLDCVFTVVSENEALIYEPGFREIPEEIQNYNWIHVSKNDYRRLGPNVVPIGDRVILASDTTLGVNSALSAAGFTVVEVPFSYTEEAGGSLRCCSVPILRTTLTLEAFLALVPAARELAD